MDAGKTKKPKSSEWRIFSEYGPYVSVVILALCLYNYPIWEIFQNTKEAEHDTQLVKGGHSVIHQHDTARSLHNVAQVLGHVSRLKEHNYIGLDNCGGDGALLEELKITLREVSDIMPSAPSVDFVNILMCSDGFKNGFLNYTRDDAPVRVNHQNWEGLSGMPVKENCVYATLTAISAYFENVLGRLYEKGVLRKCPHGSNVCDNTQKAFELTQRLRQCTPNVSEEDETMFGTAMQILVNVRSTTEAKDYQRHVFWGGIVFVTCIVIMGIFICCDLDFTRWPFVLFLACLYPFSKQYLSFGRDWTYSLEEPFLICIIFLFPYLLWVWWNHASLPASSAQTDLKNDE